MQNCAYTHDDWAADAAATVARHSVSERAGQRHGKEEKKKTSVVFRVYWFAKNGMELKIIYGWFLFLCILRY